MACIYCHLHNPMLSACPTCAILEEEDRRIFAALDKAVADLKVADLKVDSLGLLVMWNKEVVVSKTAFEDPPKPTTCPCGIDSRDCEYHR